MKREPIAVLTPIPPQSTGIADYAAGLISGLRSNGIPVDIYVPSRFMAANPHLGDEYYPIRKFNPSRYQAERTFYHIGNNREFHDEIILCFMQHGGVAHIHDLCLHHIFAHFSFTSLPAIYYALIKKWYGEEAENYIRNINDNGPMFWEGSNALSYPLNEEIISRACAVIVHSEFAKEKIASKFSEKPVHVVPQRYPDGAAVRHKKGRKLKVCSLGYVDPNKCVENKIAAIALCQERGIEVQLDVVGRLHPQCVDLPRRAEELGVAERVKFHGAVSGKDFVGFFTHSDVCIVMREPTMGETSATAMRALQYGIPLIVNDVGSYKELPEFVPKIPTGASMTHDLADALCELASRPGYYETISNAAFEYAKDEASFDASIRCYVKALELIENDAHRAV